MRILITGGTGLIGRHLIDRLHLTHEITVLTRDKSRAASALPENVSLIGSLTEIADFSTLDAVINLAGEPIADKRWNAMQKRRICDSRWEITRELVARIKTASQPPHTFLSGSAIGYYGRQGDTPVTEKNHTVHREFTHELCQKWENIALEVSDVSRVCLLRTGIVLAKGEGALDKMTLPFKLGLGGKMGDGKQYMSWIHIDDMVKAIIFLLNENDCEGAFNMTAPHPVTNKTFTSTLADVLHRPSIFTVPSFALKAAMGEAAEMLLTGQKVLPEKLQQAGFTFTHPDLEGALKDIFNS
ncbi:TIGR01777 family protein [Salinimonas sp. HHU 13199]|uniref:TIGR01777 family protein n=1 Tax=Salinimonas profundi TaxID=2729140 RepID=A0ABR8LLV5_9ALTE|nr:TIGR01777 family oxidoreductase [Salinimonas profundi]MBD3585064.1 TIGR01777 family protein [Salinimonas profundi]